MTWKCDHRIYYNYHCNPQNWSLTLGFLSLQSQTEITLTSCDQPRQHIVAFKARFVSLNHIHMVHLALTQ